MQKASKGRIIAILGICSLALEHRLYVSVNEKNIISKTFKNHYTTLCNKMMSPLSQDVLRDQLEEWSWGSVRIGNGVSRIPLQCWYWTGGRSQQNFLQFVVNYQYISHIWNFKFYYFLDCWPLKLAFATLSQSWKKFMIFFRKLKKSDLFHLNYLTD